MASNGERSQQAYRNEVHSQQAPPPELQRALSVDAALEHIFENGTGRWTVICVAVLTTNAVVAALECNLLSFLSICAVVDFGVPEKGVEVLASVAFAGQIVGMLFWMPLADIVGRWRILFGTTVLMLLFNFMSAAAPTFGVLLVLRGLVGFSQGAWMVAIDLLAEYVPAKKRGFMLNFGTNIGWGMGSTMICGIAWLTIPTLGWRAFLLASALPFLFILSLIFKLTESPRWLMSEGRPEEALRALKKIAETNGCDLPCERILPTNSERTPLSIGGGGGDHGHGGVGASNGKANLGLIRAIRRYAHDYKELLAPKQLLLTLAVWTLWFCGLFAYNGIVLFDTSVVSQDLHPPSACHFNYGLNMFISSSEILGGIAVIPLLDRADLGWMGGRRGTQLWCYFVSCVALLLMGKTLSSSWVIAVVCAYISRGLITGGTGVMILQVPELYGTKNRATASGAASIAGTLGAFVAPYWVFSAHPTFHLVLLFVAIVPVGALMLLVTPETAQSSLDEDLVPKDLARLVK